MQAWLLYQLLFLIAADLAGVGGLWRILEFLMVIFLILNLFAVAVYPPI